MANMAATTLPLGVDLSPAGPSRASTTDSLDRQLNALGLESSTNDNHVELPSYNVAVQDGPLRYAALAEKATGADEKQAEIIAEQTLLDRATAFLTAAQPVDGSYSPLDKPILIPRLNPGPNIPFARAWAPSLQAYDISQHDFLSFLDNLNVVCAPHPAARILEMLAFGVAFVPADGADGISGGLALLAALTAWAIARSRRKKYLALVNAMLFHPRGLHARVVSTKQMRAMLDIAPGEPLMAPLGQETLALSAQERNVLAMRQWAAELEFEGLPAPDRAMGLLNRFGAWQVRRKTWQADKEARRGRKRAWKKHLKGKKLKEGKGEKFRIRWLSWVMVQNLSEWEAEQKEMERRKTEKEGKGWRWGRS